MSETITSMDIRHQPINLKRQKNAKLPTAKMVLKNKIQLLRVMHYNTKYYEK